MTVVDVRIDLSKADLVLLRKRKRKKKKKKTSRFTNVGFS